MNHDLSSLSEQELADLLSAASKTLGLKRDAHKREMIATIRELAKSIGVDVEIREAGIKAAHDKRAAVPIKYRDPHDPKHAWSGRGVKPRWLRALLDQGRSIEEFRV